MYLVSNQVSIKFSLLYAEWHGKGRQGKASQKPTPHRGGRGGKQKEWKGERERIWMCLRKGKQKKESCCCHDSLLSNTVLQMNELFIESAAAAIQFRSIYPMRLK